jgi:hypothetical protein
VEAAAASALRDHGVGVLVGGSGLGKSLIARTVAQSRDNDISLVDLRDLDAHETRRRLDFLFGRIGTLPSHAMIFEDLNHLEDNSVAIAFGRVMEALRRRDRVALVTCYRKPIVRTLNQAGLDAGAILQVPYFSQNESKEVVLASGGNPDVWGPIGYAAGGQGHPQLVHAFVIGIAARGWPTSELRDVVMRGLSSDDIDAAREAARRQLASDLPEAAATCFIV